MNAATRGARLALTRICILSRGMDVSEVIAEVLRIDEIDAYPTHTGYVHALAGESNDLPAFADQSACETGPNDPASSCDDGHPSAPVRSQRLQVWLHFNSFLG